MLKQQLDLDAEMRPGVGGVFDVAVDGELIFSRHRVGRFPELEEIVAALRAR